MRGLFRLQRDFPRIIIIKTIKIILFLYRAAAPKRGIIIALSNYRIFILSHWHNFCIFATLLILRI